MSDLISKSEALELIEHMMETYWDRKQILSIVRNGIEKLPSTEQWTLATDGLPDKDVPVLVYLFGDSPYIAWINRDGEWETEEFIIDCDYLPKAWMELPEPYEEDKR